MKNAFLALANAAFPVVLVLASLWSAANAQTTTQTQATAVRPDQTIQRIRTEDEGSRIDEVRIGGQTQSITVQPKVGGNFAAYEVKPLDTARSSVPAKSSSDTVGSRVWNVLKF